MRLPRSPTELVATLLMAVQLKPGRREIGTAVSSGPKSESRHSLRPTSRSQADGEVEGDDFVVGGADCVGVSLGVGVGLGDGVGVGVALGVGTGWRSVTVSFALA